MRPRFLADAMLGDVARWLRILGEDCTFADPAWDDDGVLLAVQSEGRILVTRDLPLAARARLLGVQVVAVPREGIENILAAVYAEAGSVPEESRLATRCSLCNGALSSTDGQGAVRAALAFGKEPPHEEVLARHSVFWSCGACGQPYWRGTHWAPIEATRQRVLARM